MARLLIDEGGNPLTVIRDLHKLTDYPYSSAALIRAEKYVAEEEPAVYARPLDSGSSGMSSGFIFVATALAVAVIAFFLNRLGGSSDITMPTTPRPTAIPHTVPQSQVESVLRTMRPGACWDGIMAWDGNRYSYVTLPREVPCSAANATTTLVRIRDTSEQCDNQSDSQGTTGWLPVGASKYCLSAIPQIGGCVAANLADDKILAFIVDCTSPNSPRFHEMLKIVSAISQPEMACPKGSTHGGSPSWRQWFCAEYI